MTEATAMGYQPMPSVMIIILFLKRAMLTKKHINAREVLICIVKFEYTGQAA
jgi:hypothetical protein